MVSPLCCPLYFTSGKVICWTKLPTSKSLQVMPPAPLQNDFTPEEEEEVRRENQWAFE